jgi:arsenate reductase-like glutaredoxin family protein
MQVIRNLRLRLALLPYVLKFKPMAGAETPETPPADPPAAPPADPPSPSPAPPPDKTFTQKDVDKIVTDRLARQRSQFSDYDDLKTKAEEFDKLQSEKQSDTEKLIARAEAAERAAQKAADDKAEADKAREDALQTANKTLRRSAIIAAAAKAQAIDPSEVYALLQAQDFQVQAVDEDEKPVQYEVTIGDDNQVTGADETVATLLALKPHLVGEATPRPGPSDGGTHSTPVPVADIGAEDDPQKVREMARQYASKR